MEFQDVLIWLGIAGAVGGLIGQAISGPGLLLPHIKRTEGNGYLVPGFLGAMLGGILASIINWLVYGPFADTTVVGGPEEAANAAASGANVAATSPEYSITALMLGTSLLIGLVGARWLSTETEKRLFKATAEEAARKPADPQLADTIATSRGAAAYRAVME